MQSAGKFLQLTMNVATLVFRHFITLVYFCWIFVRSDNVLYTVSWWDATHVIATWTNRVQNQSQLIMYDTQGTGSPILNDEETEGWLQPNRPVRAAGYALLLQREDSNTSAGRFRHVIRYINVSSFRIYIP